MDGTIGYYQGDCSLEILDADVPNMVIIFHVTKHPMSLYFGAIFFAHMFAPFFSYS